MDPRRPWPALLMMLALPLVGGANGLHTSLLMLGTGLACTVLYKLIKEGARRPRPCARHARLFTTVEPLDEFSFPSGHTMHAVAFSLVAVTALLVWGCSALLWWSRKGGWHRAALAGVLLGAIPTVRYPEALFALGIGTFLLMYWRRPKVWIDYVAATAGAFDPDPGERHPA